MQFRIIALIASTRNKQKPAIGNESLLIVHSGMHHTLTPRRERWLLVTLAGIQFTHILDFMIMMPLGPQLTAVFHITERQFGWLISSYTLSGGVAGLLVAFYIERFDRKKLLLFLYGLFALATLACGLAESYQGLLLARIAAGVFGGVLSALTQTIVADVVPFARRGRAVGIVMTAFSFSTVAGVPLGLILASHTSWHTPFILIAALCVVLMGVAQVTVPALNGHLQSKTSESAWSRMTQVLVDANHQQAFVFSGLMMSTGFTVIPYITIYLQTNQVVPAQDIPLLYLLGGIATLFTAPLFGRLTDSWGKVVMFRLLATVVLVPLFAITVLPAGATVLALMVSTLFFIFMSGRIIPGMALLSATANPALRGTFMTLNASVQSLAMGLAAFAGGAVLVRDSSGLVQNYWMAALLGGIASVLSIWMAGKLQLRA
jgi:predicted MFS family arabinose efflux permease